MPEKTKPCARCEKRLPTTAFSPNRGWKDGLFPYCRPCHAAQQAAYRADPLLRLGRHLKRATEELSAGRLDSTKRNLEKVRTEYEYLRRQRPKAD